MELTAALKLVDAIITNHRGTALKDPEIVILEGTWQGLTYEQMADGSEYSTNYLMRDSAPKLWKQLSTILGHPIGKTNFRIEFAAYAQSRTQSGPQLEASKVNALEVSSRTNASRSERLYEASSVLLPVLYGYKRELMQVQNWLEQGLAHPQTNTPKQATLKQAPLKPANRQVRLIGLWGLRGIGKSLLCKTAVTRTAIPDSSVILRSFRQGLSLDDFCTSILNSLNVAASRQRASSALLALMDSRQMLFIFEEIETILRPGTLAGEYLLVHQDYRDFFQAALAINSSVIIVTGTEGPADWVSQSGYNPALRSIFLGGLSEAAATELLRDEALLTPEYWTRMIARYQGHPLALKSAARIIREMFNGRVDSFLEQTSAPLNDVVHLLAPSFNRLSDSENRILDWLASQGSPLSLTELQQTIELSKERTALVSILESLKQRALITVCPDPTSPTFRLPALVESYVVQKLLAQFVAEEISPKAHGFPAPSQTTHFRTDNILTLSSVDPQPTHLSQWVHGYFSADWHPVYQLFEGNAPSKVRLRGTYHLRDKTFVKRFKYILLSSNDGSEYNILSMHLEGNPESAPTQDSGPVGEVTAVILLAAVHQNAEGLYEICMQVQMPEDVKGLPDSLALRLLNSQQVLIAEVQSSKESTFIQLPYFLGKKAESFQVELTYGQNRHLEAFLV
ncbi:MAG: DUF1822 family protein [Cyanobacteria bacterium J06588_5]